MYADLGIIVLIIFIIVFITEMHRLRQWTKNILRWIRNRKGRNK